MYPRACFLLCVSAGSFSAAFFRGLVRGLALSCVYPRARLGGADHKYEGESGLDGRKPPFWRFLVLPSFFNFGSMLTISCRML